MGVQCLPMSPDDLGHQFNALRRRHIRKADQPRMRNVMQINQLPEVRVNRNQNAVLGFRKPQQHLIPWVGTKLPGLKHVVSRTAEPLC
ncbi:MAG: hypothetical protein OXU67_00760 [Chloroflexota bacterium]|nr:hypothetical protein [Chloroflexota bacterium]